MPLRADLSLSLRRRQDNGKSEEHWRQRASLSQTGASSEPGRDRSIEVESKHRVRDDPRNPAARMDACKIFFTKDQLRRSKALGLVWRALASRQHSLG